MRNMSETRLDTNGAPMDIDEEALRVAEEKKARGNDHYVKKQYAAALECYTAAIEASPSTAAFYSNRAATFMMLNKWTEALADARECVKLDPEYLKGYMREGKCHLVLGDPKSAIRSYQMALQLEPGNEAATAECQVAQAVLVHENNAETDYARKEFRRVVYSMDRALEHSTKCSKYKLIKAESLAMLSRFQEAQEMANEVLQSDTMNCDALFVRGLCLYYADNLEKAYQHFQQVLRLSPDHAKARDCFRRAKRLQTKKEEGNAAFKQSDWESALTIYTDALEIDPHNKPTNAKLYNNRAMVNAKLKRLEASADDCSKAIELDENYQKAYLRRFRTYQDLGKHEEAVRDVEKLCQMDRGNREYKQLLRDAKLELKKSKRKDYYKVLGVGKDASDDEIKKGYRKRALVHHPDRHTQAEEAERKEEEKKFKEVNEAYSVLSDKNKRARYDAGHDLEEDGGGPGGDFGDIDPNQIFQAFFGGGGGPGGGMPGGFQFQFGGPGGHSHGGPGGHSHGGHSHGGNQHFSFSFG